MIWDCEQLITSSNPVILPCSFTAQLLAIDIAAGNQKNTWYKAGYLQSFIEIEGTKFVGNRSKLIFGSQLIEVPYRTYQLQYDPADWLQNINIKIKQLSTTQIQTIMPNYASFPASIGGQPVLDSLPTSFSAPQYLAATLPAAYQCLPANPLRQSFAVTNLGTATVYLDLDAPTAANKRFIAIAAGGTYVSDFPYVGAVFIWSINATAQACEIREFIQ
jgi:hypothetical protein